jgi:putative SOS response-associated peptidase YedK
MDGTILDRGPRHRPALPNSRQIAASQTLKPVRMCVCYQFRDGEARPGQQVPVQREFDGPLENLQMRWGLIPFAARGIAGEHPLIHAPLAELGASALYRGLWVNGQRCVQLATSYQFWTTDAQGHQTGWLVRPANHEVFGLAALWDRSQPEDGTMIESCALVLLPGGRPTILRPEDQAAWLSGTPEQAAALLAPYPASSLRVTPMHNVELPS